MRFVFIVVVLLFPGWIIAQQVRVKGVVTDVAGHPLSNVSITLMPSKLGTVTDSMGVFYIDLPDGKEYMLHVSAVNYQTERLKIKDSVAIQNIVLKKHEQPMDEIVISGTLRPVSKLASPIPVEVYKPVFFNKNQTACLFDAVAMINGVQPQLNCNVCNTGDIHINGMEGPYTMILIDGMPIVSALSTVYGLNGIPNSLVERIEVVKGPASSLYGSEAMGGIINVITKNAQTAPRVSADIFATSWGEINADAGFKLQSKKVQSLLGINYFNYQQKIDKNKDNFTDLTLQDRISIFNKWSFDRKNNRQASVALRYVYEDRWGGEMNWNKQFRGSDSIYGESVYTNRGEAIATYEWPVEEKIITNLSYNWHQQDSYYGDMKYFATQQVAFLQTYWTRQWHPDNHLLLGGSYRYTVYDDNTPATASPGGDNVPAKSPIVGGFLQNEWSINNKNTLLTGYRYDYDKHHGSIHSPRVAYKYTPNSRHTVRASFGTGFRVVNLFTEDHAALTGAREVVIAEALAPERSYNANLNYVTAYVNEWMNATVDVSAFYTHFTNKITGDFDTDPDKIIYSNLDGYAISKGISLNTDIRFRIPLQLMLGISYMEVFQKRKNEDSYATIQQLHAPHWSGTFVATYQLPKKFTVDLTGQWYGPMRLPVLPNDYRPEYSPWFCTANIQVTKKLQSGITLFGGVKNLFDFVPRHPLMRPFDPFDKNVGDSVSNPYGYTFDTEYNYASLQGIRVFAGLRFSL